MPTFATGTPPSGIYNPFPQQHDDYSDILNLSNQIKNRDLQDFKEKAQFMSDLSLRQNRLQRIYDNALNQNQSSQSSQGSQPNTVMGFDPNQMTGYQKGELGIRQQQANTESQRQQQQGQLGQQALSIKSAQEQLNQQKSDQINAQKTADLQRKTDEANQKLALSQQALQDKTKSAEDHLQAQKDYQVAVEERHKLEMDSKQHQFDVTTEQHNRQIKDLEDKLKQASKTTTITKISPDQQTKTTTTTKGDQNSSDKPKVMTDPKTGHMYDTSNWTDNDFTQAAKRGFTEESSNSSAEEETGQ